MSSEFDSITRAVIAANSPDASATVRSAYATLKASIVQALGASNPVSAAIADVESEVGEDWTHAKLAARVKANTDKLAAPLQTAEAMLGPEPAPEATIVQTIKDSIGVIQQSGTGNTANITINLNAALAELKQATDAGRPPLPTTRTKLVETLDKGFNLDEIKSLCFAMGVDYENIEGASKSAKIRELILYCERRNKLTQLSGAIREMRPEL